MAKPRRNIFQPDSRIDFVNKRKHACTS
jgi:hypothetical protein